MPTVTLLRHGQASFGAADYDNLSELGHRQARVAADTLAARGLRNPVVASGTLRRQRDTAAPVARRFGVDDDGRQVAMQQVLNSTAIIAILEAYSKQTISGRKK